MDLEELRAVQTRERATDGLQELRESFYADVATYIQDLRDERDRRAADTDDPFGDPKVTDLTDEIEVAEQVAEAIYERRIGKLVKQASLAAAGMPDDQTGLTAEERDLYTDLVDRIQENKQVVLDVIAGDAPVETVGGASSASDSGTESERETGSLERESPSNATGSAPAKSDEESDSRTSMADAEPQSTDAERPDSDREADVRDGTGDGETTADEVETEETATGGSSDVERTAVLITSDVGEIFGVDGEEYSLYEDDVVELPAENAAPLLERDAAEELE